MLAPLLTQLSAKAVIQPKKSSWRGKKERRQRGRPLVCGNESILLLSKFLLVKISLIFGQNIVTCANLLFLLVIGVTMGTAASSCPKQRGFSWRAEAEDALLMVRPLEQRTGSLETRSSIPYLDAGGDLDICTSSIPVNRADQAGSFIFSLGEGKEQTLSGLDSRCCGCRDGVVWSESLDLDSAGCPC